MTLNEIFKNTNYDDTLFSDEAKKAIEDAIILKEVKGAEVPYECVELIDTTNGMFMSPWEAKWMALSGSALLVGKK